MDQLTHNWLSTLCKLLKDVSRAVVFLDNTGKGGYSPIAFWPEGLADYQDFAAPAKTALAKDECIMLHNRDTEEETGEPFDIIACPLFLGEQLCGVLVLQISSRVAAKQQAAIQQVEEAAVWYKTIVTQSSSTEKSQLGAIVELVASCLEHERFQAAATDVVTDLASRFSCDRISIGFLHGTAVQVEAVSHSAGFDAKSSIINDISEAMHEAMDQNSTIVYPQPTDAVVLTRCHEALVKEHGSGEILTVPFVANNKISGAVLAERPADRAYDQECVEHLEQIVSMIGPVLEIRHRDEQWLPKKIGITLQQPFAKLLGPGHIGLKLSSALLLLFLAFISLKYGDYRITGKARLVAHTQRVVVASQDGYIASANVRPGDIIKSGEILGALDDKDLVLEQRKWASQLEQLQTEYRDALARHARSSVSIINARILQAQAQLNLVNEQLSRTRFAAPFDGLIVSGDLSQALGSPVERGQVLFTVAPLDVYRVILMVDERDIGNVKEGQPGNLTLSGLPRKPFSFTVEKITPVSTPEEGRNFFQVEAKIKKTSDLLRPGMEGVAKINIDQRKLIWIWTHKLVDWIRLTLWSIRP